MVNYRKRSKKSRHSQHTRKRGGKKRRRSRHTRKRGGQKIGTTGGAPLPITPSIIVKGLKVIATYKNALEGMKEIKKK